MHVDSEMPQHLYMLHTGKLVHADGRNWHGHLQLVSESWITDVCQKHASQLPQHDLLTRLIRNRNELFARAGIPEVEIPKAFLRTLSPSPPPPLPPLH